MKPFAPDQHRTCGTPSERPCSGRAADQGFTPALSESNGSVVNVNSMVDAAFAAQVRRLQDGEVGAALAMSQTLATELGDQGIRVQFCTGYIWGGTLRPTSRTRPESTAPPWSEIYEASAASSDLSAAHRGRGGLGHPVHGQRSVQRYHRSGAGCQLQGVQGVKGDLCFASVHRLCRSRQDRDAWGCTFGRTDGAIDEN